VAKVIACLNEHKADSVTVPLVANMGNGLVQNAICELQNTYLGHGGSPHRKIGRSGWTNHGHHAGFLLRSFVAVGGYDTEFEANEDYELDVRLRVAGKGIFQFVETPVSYIPRANVLGLARQMFRNGQGRAKTALKHGQPPCLRQLLPVLATIFTLSALAVAMFSPWVLIVPLFYFLAVVFIATFQTSKPLSVAVLAMTSHISFGLGFIMQLLKRLAENTRIQPTRAIS
jgi:succinoglycan biosynthesis protein ExoA